MNTIKKFSTASAVALSLLSSVAAQPVVVGNRIEFGAGVEVTRDNDRSADAPLMRFATQDGKLPLLEIGKDGSLEFFNGATLDFAGFVPEGFPVGQVPRWVAVRVAGEVYLMPLFPVGNRPLRYPRPPCQGEGC